MTLTRESVVVNTEDFHNTVELLAQINEEAQRQERLWGEQNHPFIAVGDYANPNDVHVDTIRCYFAEQADEEKLSNDLRAAGGDPDWRGILLEEVYEALAEGNADNAVTELVQVAAVALSAAKSIRRNGLEGA